MSQQGQGFLDVGSTTVSFFFGHGAAEHQSGYQSSVTQDEIKNSDPQTVSGPKWSYQIPW